MTLLLSNEEIDRILTVEMALEAVERSQRALCAEQAILQESGEHAAAALPVAVGGDAGDNSGLVVTAGHALVGALRGIAAALGRVGTGATRGR